MKAHTGPLYSHWLAIDMYNSYHSPSFVDAYGQVSVKIGGHVYSISSDSLNATIHTLHQVTTLGSRCKEGFGFRGVVGSSDLCGTEIALTACFSRALDRFLFPGKLSTTGACFHQLPVFKIGSGIQKPDLYITGFMDGCPSNPVALCDCKLEEFTKAKKESIAYCIQAMHQPNCAKEKQNLCTNLGLCFTQRDAMLFVVAGDDKFVRVTDVARISFECSPESDVRAFFAVLYGAVHYLLNNPITSVTGGIVPFKGFKGEALDTHRERDSRTFRVANRVCKLYDSKIYSSKPNVGVVQLIDANYLPSMTVKTLTTDSRIQILEYEYIRGDHHPHHKEQFKKIRRDLGKLHDKGYVHSDIRRINLLFGEGENDAWIIDFDLAAKEGDEYPEGYNHYNIMERHEGARAGLPRKRDHDLHAVSILEQIYFPSP